MTQINTNKSRTALEDDDYLRPHEFAGAGAGFCFALDAFIQRKQKLRARRLRATMNEPEKTTMNEIANAGGLM